MRVWVALLSTIAVAILSDHLRSAATIIRYRTAATAAELQDVRIGCTMICGTALKVRGHAIDIGNRIDVESLAFHPGGGRSFTRLWLLVRDSSEAVNIGHNSLFGPLRNDLPNYPLGTRDDSRAAGTHSVRRMMTSPQSSKV